MPTTRVRLSQQTYRHDGHEYHFWSLAPVFATNFAVGKISGMPRSFAWLYSAERREFIHACISTGSDLVLRVKPGDGGVVRLPAAA